MTNPSPPTPPVEQGPLDEKRMVREARNGSRTAFHQLMMRFHEPIYRMVFFRVNTPMDAEDLTQDIFLKAFQGIGRLRAEDQFKGWLYRIARNRIRDHYRKKRWTSLFTSLDTSVASDEPRGDEWAASDAPGPDEKLLQQDFWRQVERALQHLSTNERDIFVFRFFDQLDIREIAQAMKKNENTVKTHLYRAIKKMKNHPEASKIWGEIGFHER